MNMVCVYVLFMLYFDFGLNFLEMKVFVCSGKTSHQDGCSDAFGVNTFCDDLTLIGREFHAVAMALKKPLLSVFV